MNVIALEVTDTGAPFVQGINVIVIPTDLFANTKLHAIIEQAVDDQGDFNRSKIPNYLQDADFCSMDKKSVSQFTWINNLKVPFY
ncbi:MAG: hypothetical protein GF329_17830 [Candidatus Lokiarchaeota archaeon]|nr:hypothetical protein [Candidatus Lokiarchaeota archaeon]